MNQDSPSRKRVQTPTQPRLRERLKEAASTAILEAAEAVFSEEGLDARMESIAARAGVAVGTLYNHFKDRQALVEAVQDARRDRIKAAVEEAIESSRELPFRELLLSILRSVVEKAESPSGFRRILFQSDQPIRHSRKREFSKLFVGLLQPHFTRAIRAGELRPDPEHLHGHFLTGLISSALGANLEGLIPIEEVPERVVSQFLDGASPKERR